MKKNIIALLLVLAVGLGAVVVYQHKQVNQLRADLDGAHKKLKSLEEQLAQKAESDDQVALAETKAKVLQETLKETTAASARQSQQVSQLEQSLAAAQTNAGPDFGRLLKDPNMREMIREQQKAYMGPMIDKSYGELFKQLSLTPEQSAYVKELLEKKMLTAAEAGMSMMDGSMDAEKRKEIAGTIKEGTDQIDAEIKKFLGEENSQTFDQYEKSLPDRMSVGQFRDQISGSDLSLNAAQEKQLIALMQEERTNFKWTTDFNNQAAMASDPMEMFTEDRLNAYAQEKERLDRQVLERARAALKPEQLNSLDKFLTSQRNMQISAMKMARQMFSPQPPPK
jgi:hypothetical protein